MRLEGYSQLQTNEHPGTAFFTQRGSSFTSSNVGGGGNQSKNYNYGRGRGRGTSGCGRSTNDAQYNRNTRSSTVPVCQICNRTNLVGLDCFHSLDLSYQRKKPPQKLQAMVASKHLLSLGIQTQGPPIMSQRTWTIFIFTQITKVLIQ